MDKTSIAGLQPSSRISAAGPLLYALLGVALIAAVTWHSGTTGIFLFDMSIGIFSGWLVANGWVPFRDFATPLMPLNALLVAATFKLFGVNYLATVVVSAVLAAVTFVLSFSAARRLVADWLACACALMATLSTMPTMGTLYYNHLSAAALLIYGMMALVLIARSEDEGDRAVAPRVGIGVLLMLVALTKLHVGVGFIALQTALELFFFVASKRRSVRHLAFSLALIGTPAFVALLAIAASVGFDLPLIALNLGVTDLQSQLGVVKLRVYAGLGGANSADPSITPSLLVLLLGSAAFTWWREGQRARVHFAPLGFAIGLIAVDQLASAVSLEGATLHFFSYAVAVVALLQSAPDRHRPLLSAMLMPTVATLLIFITSYDLRVFRKRWSETNFAFQHMPSPDRTTTMPFFRGLRLWPELAVVMDEVAKLKSRNPAARVMYGPGLEAFFPATGDLPPKGWANWFHPGLSYRSHSLPQMREAFERERYDYVLIVDRRVPILQPSLRRLYQPCRRIAGWATLFCLKGSPLKGGAGVRP